MAENLKAVCQAAWELLDAMRECDHVDGEDLVYARMGVTAASDVLKKALYKADEEVIGDGVTALRCEVCGDSSVKVGEAHFHNRMLIGECCWDDRLYASE